MAARQATDYGAVVAAVCSCRQRDVSRRRIATSDEGCRRKVLRSRGFCRDPPRRTTEHPADDSNVAAGSTGRTSDTMLGPRARRPHPTLRVEHGNLPGAPEHRTRREKRKLMETCSFYPPPPLSRVSRIITIVVTTDLRHVRAVKYSYLLEQSQIASRDQIHDFNDVTMTSRRRGREGMALAP